jgi:hypothetical protein
MGLTVRSVLSLFTALVLSSAVIGCEEAPIGARCESINDCDRTGAGTTRSCFSHSNPNQPCPGGGASCLCCPAISMRVPGTTIATCIGSSTPTPDASTPAPDASSPADAATSSDGAASSDASADASAPATNDAGRD